MQWCGAMGQGAGVLEALSAAGSLHNLYCAAQALLPSRPRCCLLPTRLLGCCSS